MDVDSFCEVCGDTGGATRLVLCENVDAGCLGGVHLYCCVPLLSEAPSEAWYCSECAARRREARAAREAARREREAARRLRHAARQQERAERKRKRREEREAACRLKQRQEEEQRQAPAAQAAAARRPASAAGLATVPRQGSGVAAVIAAASGRPLSSGRGPGAAAAAAAPRQAATPGSLASRDTLSFLLDSMDREDARLREQEERERQRMAAMLQGDARRMQASQAQHDKLRHELAARYNLLACQAAGQCWSGMLELPLPNGGSFLASLACYALPGNPQCREAVERALVPLAAAVATAEPLAWQFKRCKEELGLLHTWDAWEQASMLLQIWQDPAPQAQQAAQLWRSLWRTLQERNQALAIQLPAADGSSDGEEGGSASPSGEGGSGSAERLFLYLVPNDYEQVQPTMFGLLGVPLPEPEHPRPCSARQPPGSILRRRRPNDGDDDSGAQGVLPAAAAEEAVAAAAAAEPATADGSALQAAAAAVPTELAAAAPEPATGGGEPAAASVQPAASESEEEGELSPTAAAPAAAPAAAAAGEARHQLGWADVCGDRSALDRLDRAALELGKGSHYATPTRLAAGAARPARTPLIRSFEQLVEAEAAGSEGPLTGLHVARWGFDKHIDMQDPALLEVLKQLRALGAATYPSAQLVNVLVVHPSIFEHNGLETRARDVPLGLAHLLASTDVHVYVDPRCEILRLLARRQRPLLGGQWCAPEFRPIFPGGLTALLDYATLASLRPDQLDQVLAGMQVLKAGAPDPTWAWHVAAAPADLAALQAAAARGQAPAADNWRRWQASSVTRALEDTEMLLPTGGPPVCLAAQYAANIARQRFFDCRLVFLCSCDPDTVRQGEDRHTILCGGAPELLDLLQQQLERQPQQAEEWQRQQQQQRQRQQQHVMLRPPEQPPPLLRKK